MKLFSYFRSSAAYRVRIALNLKQVEHELVFINLLKSEQLTYDYQVLQPQGLVPCLQLASGDVITQSGAILAYIDAQYPQYPLMPANLLSAVKVRSIVDMVACDIHPLNNLRVLKYLSKELAVEDKQKQEWYRHWIQGGFAAIEQQLENQRASTPNTGVYAMGENVTMVDVYLVPQIYNALRFEVDMQGYPNMMRAYDACNKLDAFIQAAPQNQPDSTI
ncbi:maleylacetoacetate isomerase [Paraglaciecola polaris]|uniref:Maleylacetoacetate isomerase n=1 Tax=Paraglaciecola polaris LMG 21857 TaxID=1129793 RepID=K6YK35_9ALTE|nr:maleylacetoacetate isomerase [Paraglaciecola polaris]GAC33074.1 maleylacetoacetate isomerase [Paraglaciecola polaris LMG 21857]